MDELSSSHNQPYWATQEIQTSYQALFTKAYLLNLLPQQANTEEKQHPSLLSFEILSSQSLL